jgi:hypothetical protein
VPIDSDPDDPERARGTRASADAPDAPDAAGRPDAPHASADRAPRDASQVAAFRERQRAAHARYREQVEASDQAYAARQAWAEAVPELRASWAEHKARYPERSRSSPRTQPDGAWAGDGGRRLTPEQHAEAAKAHADLQAETRDVIFPAMLRIEAASPHGTLAGTEHRLKGEDRLKEKIADALEVPGITVREAIDLVPDAVRFTLTYDSERYSDGVMGDVDQLKAEGFELIKLKNLWHADQYKGVNSQWRRPETGLRFEMQFHTPESLEAKELTHPAYERIRGQAASSDEKVELEGFQRRVNGLIATPPGTERIKNFPEQNDDRQSHLLRDY